jgi:hypothetical protein
MTLSATGLNINGNATISGAVNCGSLTTTGAVNCENLNTTGRVNSLILTSTGNFGTGTSNPFYRCQNIIERYR